MNHLEALKALAAMLEQEPFDFAIAGEIVHQALSAPQEASKPQVCGYPACGCNPKFCPLDESKESGKVEAVADEQAIIARFLEQTGQYVTNDVSRVAAVLSAFDEAVAAELPRVSTVAYNSHEICKWFASNVRETLSLYRDASGKVHLFPASNATPIAWLSNTTDPQPHAVTDLKYRSARCADAGIEYVPVYLRPSQQALSVEEISPLRHLYSNLVNGGVRDTSQAKRIAEGLLAPVIERLEAIRALADVAGEKGVGNG